MVDHLTKPRTLTCLMFLSTSFRTSSWASFRTSFWPPLWGILLFTIAPAYTHAALSASLSESLIDELETVRLTIRASQTRQTETLDLSALETDFQVLGTNTSSQYSLINGRERSWVDYQITLQPKRTGEITIPSITIGDEQTPTINLTVRPLTDETRKLIDELVFFEQELSSETIYVQAQLVVTRRLLYSNGVQLYSDLPGPPEIENAVVLTLGDPVSATTQRNGRQYGVVEQRFAIFPELSGSLTIPPINLTASVRLINNGRVTRKGVRVGTNSAKVTVNPVPPTYPADAPWIPATDLVLHRVLTPDLTEYKVGDTINLETLIYIEGNLGSIAPPVELELDAKAFRTYPTSPVIDDDPQRTGVVGSRLQTASVLPLTNGKHVIPPTSITWWDTNTQTVRTTTWAAQAVNVAGSPVSIDNQANGNAPNNGAVDEGASGIDEAGDQNQALDGASSSGIGERLTNLITKLSASAWLITGSICLLLVFVYFLARKLRPRLTAQGHSQAMSSKQETTRALNQLKQCSDPHQALILVDQILSAHYATGPAQARHRLMLAESASKAPLMHLNSLLYGPQANNPSVSKEAKASIEQLASILRAVVTKPAKQQQALPALYPHQQRA